MRHPLRGVDGGHRHRLAAGVVGGVLEQRRVDGGGQHGADVDLPVALQSQLLPQAGAERPDGELRHAVGVRVGLGHHTHDRGDVDDHAAALLPQVRQHRSGAVDVTHQVDVDDAAEVLQRHVGERAEHGDRGVVDPHVDAPVALDRPPCQFAHRLVVGHVGHHRQRLGSGGAALLRRRLQGLPPPGREDHRGSLLREHPRGGAPDAARRARDDHNRIPGSHENRPPAGSCGCCWIAAPLPPAPRGKRLRLPGVPAGGPTEAAVRSCPGRLAGIPHLPLAFQGEASTAEPDHRTPVLGTSHPRNQIFA